MMFSLRVSNCPAVVNAKEAMKMTASATFCTSGPKKLAQAFGMIGETLNRGIGMVPNVLASKRTFTGAPRSGVYI